MKLLYSVPSQIYKYVEAMLVPHVNSVYTHTCALCWRRQLPQPMGILKSAFYIEKKTSQFEEHLLWRVCPLEMSKCLLLKQLAWNCGCQRYCIIKKEHLITVPDSSVSQAKNNVYRYTQTYANMIYKHIHQLQEILIKEWVCAN